MDQIDVAKIIELAEQFWPKAKPFELGLLKKITSKLDFESVKGILEDARVESNYSTLPLKAVKEKLTNLQKRCRLNGGSWYDCYALHIETAKSYECMVMAASDLGAREQFIKYLLRYGIDPIDHDLYIGEENRNQFLKDRFGILAKLNPKIRETAERLRQIAESGRSMIPAVARILPEIPKPPKKKAVTKEMINELYKDEDGPDYLPL